MKTSTVLFADINKENFENLTNVVEETLAYQIPTQTKQQFSSAQLWNIQRQHKVVAIRRYYM